MENNIVAGSDGPCFQTMFEDCSLDDQCTAGAAEVDLSKRNVGHSCLRGAHYKPDMAKPCAKVNNFKLYKNIDFCIFMHAAGAIMADNILCVDNYNGIFGWTFGSNPIREVYDYFSKNSLFQRKLMTRICIKQKQGFYDN